jgi:hypothetical protein
MYCVVIILFESLPQDALGLILQTDSASNDGMSSYEDKYLKLESCLEFQGKYFDHF